MQVFSSTHFQKKEKDGFSEWMNECQWMNVSDFGKIKSATIERVIFI